MWRKREPERERESVFKSPPCYTPFSRVVRPECLVAADASAMKASVAPGEKLAGPRNKEGIKFVSAFGSTHTFAAELIELVHTPVQMMAILKLTLAKKMTSDPHPSIAPALEAERRMNARG
jgi:hypothetical protein